MTAITVPRHVSHTDLTRALAEHMLLQKLPRVPLFRPKAVATVLGLGEDTRLVHACRIANVLGVPLLVAGANRNEQTWWELSEEKIRSQPFGFDGPSVVFKGHFEHTKGQADWLADRIAEMGIDSLALVVSQFHVERAYRTLLASVIGLGQKLPVMTVETPPVPPDYLVPEFECSPDELIPGEIKRIGEYQKKGDVATPGQLTDYLTWCWQQREFAAFR